MCLFFSFPEIIIKSPNLHVSNHSISVNTFLPNKQLHTGYSGPQEHFYVILTVFSTYSNVNEF